MLFFGGRGGGVGFVVSGFGNSVCAGFLPDFRWFELVALRLQPVYILNLVSDKRVCS